MKAHTMKGLLSIFAILALALPAAALDPINVAGLNATLYTDPPMYVVTDSSGIFTFVDVPSGTHMLGISDMGTISALFLVEVTLEQAPANVVGQVTAKSAPDFGFSVSARVATAVPPAPSLSVTSASVNPKKWNVNYPKSRGKVTVTIAGTGLESIQQVTLSNPALAPAGTISTTTVILDLIDGTAVAKFGKAAAFAALVPPGTPPRTVIPIQVVVTGPAGSFTFDKNLVILGKLH